MKTPVATIEDGIASFLAPDVCFIPIPGPPGGAPGPHPNVGQLTDAKDTTKKVLIRNKKVCIGGSYMAHTKGDEPGCAKTPGRGQGVTNGKDRDKCEFAGQSSVVKFEGKGVVVLGVQTKHNDSNTMGKHTVPSQTTVIAEG